MLECRAEIALWAIMIFIITFIIVIFVAWLCVQIVKNSYLKSYIDYLEHYCDNVSNVTYNRAVYVPQTNGVYEKNLALALLDVVYATSEANCTQILPLPNPPGFTNQLRVEGTDPINKTYHMYGYIFWNNTGQAIFTFTGTHFISEWVSDLMYTLVPATALNGYQDGVMCHKGFYNIYLSVRDVYWNWWNQYGAGIKNLFITGNSLGGALSTICSFDFAGVTEIIHYSFAAPRSGNVAYANTFAERLPTSLRVNNTEDIIPALPPATWDKNTFSQTIGSIPFTISLGSLLEDHIQAYSEHMPNGPQVGKSIINV